MKIVLIGLGHEMHGDDEIGLQVVSRWAAEHGKGRPEVEALTLESPGLNLLGTIAGQAAAILVAAVQSGAPLGTIHKLNQEKLVRLVVCQLNCLFLRMVWGVVYLELVSNL